MINMVCSQWLKRIKWKLGFASLHIEGKSKQKYFEFWRNTYIIK